LYASSYFFDIRQKISHKCFNTGKHIRLFVVFNMAVIAFSFFVIISNHCPSVRIAIMKSVFKTLRIRRGTSRQFPQYHFPDRPIGVNKLGIKYQFRCHMVYYTIVISGKQRIIVAFLLLPIAHDLLPEYFLSPAILGKFQG
jgi:hypothetical protein